MHAQDFKTLIKRSNKIRARYHELEALNHGSLWTVEEDALAFITDAGLVGRNVMAQQKRWPNKDSDTELAHKIGECFWWLTILAERMELSPEELFDGFLKKTEGHLGIQ